MAGEQDISAAQVESPLAPPETAENFYGAHVETSGYFSPRAQFLRSRSAEQGNVKQASGVGVIKSRLKRQQDTLAAQLRPEFIHTFNPDISHTQLHVDELYWERQASPFSFAFIGRKRIVNGVALGRNPTDFFNLDKPEDQTLVDEDRRTERKGDDLVGWSYFGQSYSIHTIIASAAEQGKKTRVMLQLAGKIDVLSTDFSLIGYYADIPGIGLNISTLINDKTTAYAELAVRKGRDRMRPIMDQHNSVVGVEKDSSRWFPELVIGGQYTSQLGPTFIAEYWRNTNGYSNSEYAGIVSSLVSGQGKNRWVNNLINTPNFRQNKLFFRVSEIKMTERASFEMTAIYSLHDHGKFVRGAINWDLTDADSLRIGIDKFGGDKLSEYGVNPVSWRFFVVHKRYF